MRIRLLALIIVCLPTTVFANYGQYSVNDIAINMPLEEAERRLGPSSVRGNSVLPWIGRKSSDFRGFHSPVLHMLIQHKKIAVCIGDRIEFNGKILVKRGNSTDDLNQALGKPDCILDGGDEPVRNLLYYRQGFVIEATVSNDKFLHRHLTSKAWPDYCSKVWRFRLWAGHLKLTTAKGSNTGPGSR